MLDPTALRVFVAVAELRGVSAAARALGRPKSSVSRDLARLEAALGTPLVQRTTRRLGLTEAGVVLARHAAEALAALELAETAVRGLGASPRGRLRVSATFTFGRALLAPLLPEFLARYPDVRLALELTARRVDLVADRVDVAVHVGTLPDDTLVARRLADARLRLCASPAYLARRGAPASWDALADHAVIDGGLEGPGAAAGRRWRARAADGVEAIASVTPRLTTNDAALLHAAALGGAGIAWVPEFLCAEDLRAGRLTEVLPGWTRPPTAISAVFPSRRGLSPAARAFVDFLAARLRAAGLGAADSGSRPESAVTRAPARPA